jgi:hypothetical protein
MLKDSFVNFLNLPPSINSRFILSHAFILAEEREFVERHPDE